MDSDHDRSLEESEAEELNWRAILAALAIGVGVLVAALFVGRFEHATIAGVLGNIGSAIALVGVLVYFERRIVRKVNRTAREMATSAARKETAELRDRVVRLEDLEDAQNEERDRRRQANNAAVQALLDSEISHEVVGDVLVDAHQRGLFGQEFRVRTSPGPDCHLLYFMPLVDPSHVAMVWLDFEPFRPGPEIDGVPTVARGDTTVLWTHEDTPQSIASDLEAGLERINQPLNGFSLTFALQQLGKASDIATEARSGSAEDPRRLRGSVILLLNDDWVLTDFGLEAVDHTIASKIHRPFVIHPVAIGGGPGQPHLEQPTPPVGAEESLEAALTWLRDREGIRVTPPAAGA